MSDAHWVGCCKVRNSICGKIFAVAVFFLVVCVVGTGVALGGLGKLPRCRYGSESCYFFAKVCDKGLFQKNSISCVWMPKMRAIEGGDGGGNEQLWIPIMSAIVGLLPPAALLTSTIIRNEKFLLGLLEVGKVFLAFNGACLAMSIVRLDTLTFDCRFFPNSLHKNSDDCEEGFKEYIAGAIILFATEVLLVALSISFGEVERRRLADDRMWLGLGQQRTDGAVQMNVRTNPTANGTSRVQSIGGGGWVK